MLADSIQSLFLRLLPFLLVVVVAFVVFYAWVEPSPAPHPVPVPKVVASQAQGGWHFTPMASPPPAAAPMPTASLGPANRPDAMLSASSARLVSQYLSTNDTSVRMNILHDLADDARTGRAAFIQLFQKENDETLKSLIVNLAATTGEPTQDLFTLLGLASATGESQDVRGTAQRILLLNPEPQAIPVWQELLNDSDPGVRELAADQIAQIRDTSR